MKTDFVWIVSCAAMLIFTTGCVSHYRDVGADYLERPESACRASYYTEYNVAEKPVSGNGQASVLLGIFQFSDGKYCQLNSDPRFSFLNRLVELLSPTQKTVFNAKNSAIYQACENAEADQILGTTFEYKITNYLVYVSVECTAKGYPATVKSVRMLDRQPVILNSWQRIEYVAPHETPLVYSDPKHDVAPAGESTDKTLLHKLYNPSSR